MLLKVQDVLIHPAHISVSMLKVFERKYFIREKEKEPRCLTFPRYYVTEHRPLALQLISSGSLQIPHRCHKNATRMTHSCHIDARVPPPNLGRKPETKSTAAKGAVALRWASRRLLIGRVLTQSPGFHPRTIETRWSISSRYSRC